MKLISAATTLSTAVLATALTTATADVPTNATRVLSSESATAAMVDYRCVTKEVVDIDITGFDVGSASSNAPSGCYGSCYQNDNCVSWTWTNYNGGTCWLKSDYTKATYVPGAVSAVRGNCAQLNGPGVYVLLENYDMLGNDAGSFPGGTVSDCVNRALELRRPVAWSDYNGGTCWLKSARGAYQYAPNKHTVIVLSG